MPSFFFPHPSRLTPSAWFPRSTFATVRCGAAAIAAGLRFYSQLRSGHRFELLARKLYRRRFTTRKATGKTTARLTASTGKAPEQRQRLYGATVLYPEQNHRGGENGPRKLLRPTLSKLFFPSPFGLRHCCCVYLGLRLL